MASLSTELVFLILQFLDEENFNQTVHKLEQESGFFFNIKYFEDAVNNGEWDDVEKYLSGFTKIDDNRYSMKIFFEIRKQKYLEALDKRDRATAVEILVKDLKVFAAFNDDLYKELAQLLTLDNFRENEQLSKYGDTKTARAIMLVELKKLIEANPLFRDKIHFPQLKTSRLRTLINQSLNWQHQLCKNPKSNPDIKTLFTDHSCGPPNGTRAPSPSPLMAMPKPSGGFPPLGSHGPFHPAPASLTTSLSGWMANPSPIPHAAAPVGPMGLGAPSNAAMIKRPRTPNNPSLDYHSADSEHHMKRPRTLGISEETSNLPVNIVPITFAGQSNIHYSSDELPKNVLMTLNQGSAVRSMDFHPGKPTLLLVGTNVGDIAVWELSSGERIAHRNFIVRDISSCSLQAALAKEPTISVNRVAWSPDGVLFGVAYSKHIVHVYLYHSGDDLRTPVEIDAHIGSVNDLAFAQPNKHLCIVTCGDDKAIRVWDAASGSKLFTFEGHESPVFSVCPHYKESIQFIFSTATDGKIKAWLYDNMGSRVNYDAPGRCCTTMCYSADGTRLFSCGTTKEGDSHLVEWNESEGAVKRTYFGLQKRSVGVVQFDTTMNRFLAVGDEFVIKIWDMDNPNLMTTIETDGLPASPRIRFNRDGMLLAVSTNDNGIKILANTDGLRLLHPFEAARSASETIAKSIAISTSGTTGVNAGTSVGLADRGASVASIIGMNGDNRSVADVKSRITDESMEKCKTWKVMEINEPSQCRSQRLPDNLLPSQVSRLIYTNMGNAILALTSNAVHKLWKWVKRERNTNSKASSVVPPQLWQPTSGILMTNDICEANPEDAVPCFALSKNDSYVMSASGGKISLFNMMTFKTMTTFMAPPPAATFLAFHPQDNNVIAIGMDDSSIQIYNVRVDKVKSIFTGHQKRVTGLAFSNVLNVLVSSGADAQLCVWSTDAWEKQTSKFLQIPNGRVPSPLAEMCVQFHQDQIHFLAVHETQIAIYETSKLECLKQWVPPEPSVCITNATYSCDSQSIFASFDDGSVGVLSTTLRLRCRIDPTAYIPPSMNSNNSRVYPLVIAAHPSEPSQFALGLSDGGVHVLEPLESEGRWGIMPPSENGAVPSNVPGQGSSDQVVR